MWGAVAIERHHAKGIARCGSARVLCQTHPPTIPKRLSGRIYKLENNPLGIRSFAVEFADPSASTLHLELVSGEKLVQPLGMHGQYRRVSVNGGAVSAGRAEWFEGGRLRIGFNRLSLIDRFMIDAVFQDQDLNLVVSEPTEVGPHRDRTNIA